VLVGELAGAATLTWTGLTVPGREDRSNTRSGVVELMFPAADFWGLPAVAHELGHLLARSGEWPGRGRSNPVRAKIAELGSGGPTEELFCDFYATYALGPAYAAFMILDYLDPTREPAATHPPPAERVCVMLRTLEKLDEESPVVAHHSWAHAILARAWRDRLAALDRPVGVDADDGWVTNRVGQFWTVLHPELRGGYVPSRASARLAEAFGGGRGMDPDDRPDVRDVVTAAWRARLEQRAADPGAPSPRRIAERALDLAEAVGMSDVS
jgi:hypothetical protein